MSSIARSVAHFWSGSVKKGPPVNRHAPPWPAPKLQRFRPTPPPKPTTIVGKIKSYVPGRNWLIFGGFIISWISLAAYDKRERKKAVAKWCKKVEHLSRRTIAFHEDIPSVGVWIGAPPGDQLKWNKEVWRDYVKPIIVAAGFDYSLHLNARQGLTRTSMREMIRQHRAQRESPSAEEPTLPREREGGDVIIVGRNTFKEIVRGIHEGYLLPSDYVPPPPPIEESKEGNEAEKPAAPDPVLPAIPQTQYSSFADPPLSNPDYTFTYVPSLHILGLRHTPRRIYRFLTRRYVADEICEQVVACILEQSQREWREDDTKHGQQEERYWPKTVTPDAEWREQMIIDPRIRPKLLWRVPSDVSEVPNYREPSAPEDDKVRTEDLRPTEEEIARDKEVEAENLAAKLFPAPSPWNRRF